MNTSEIAPVKALTKAIAAPIKSLINVPFTSSVVERNGYIIISIPQKPTPIAMKSHFFTDSLSRQIARNGDISVLE